FGCGTGRGCRTIEAMSHRGVVIASAERLRAMGRLARVTLIAALVLAAASAQAQTVNVPLDHVDPQVLLEALALECYEAGLAADAPNDSSMDCTGVLEERAGENGDAGAAVVIRQKLRFTVLDRSDVPQITADAWTETEELGTAIETPVTTESYVSRL